MLQSHWPNSAAANQGQLSVLYQPNTQYVVGMTCMESVFVCDLEMLLMNTCFHLNTQTIVSTLVDHLFSKRYINLSTDLRFLSDVKL